jgi:pectinesterase
VLVITGGGWVNGDRKRLGHIARWLSGHGFVTAACDYKLAKPGEPSFPRNIEDCKAAIRYLRGNAARYGIDPAHIGVVGGSAGAHLAALLGTSAGVKELEGDGGHGIESSAVQAVAALAGPLNLESEKHKESKQPLVLVGKTYAEAPELFAQASPLHFLKAGAPPFLIMKGSRDQPEETYPEFRAKMKELNIPVKWIVVDDAPHGMWNMEGWFPEVSKALLDFFQSTLASAK